MATTSEEQEKLTNDTISDDQGNLKKAVALELDYQVPDLDSPQPTHGDDWHDILAHYVSKADHTFSCQFDGSFRYGPIVYQVGTMTIDKEEHVYWIRARPGYDIHIGIQHYGEITCEEKGFVPTLSKDCDTMDECPMALEIFTRGPAYLSAADPRVVYIHPDTKDELSFLEWCNAKCAHFNFMKEDTRRMINSLPAWLTTQVLSASQEDQSMDPRNIQDLRDAVGTWGRPDIKLRDGFPLVWTHVCKDRLDAEDLVRSITSVLLRQKM